MGTYLVLCPSCGYELAKTDGTKLWVSGDGAERIKTTAMECSNCGSTHVWHSKRGGNYAEVVLAQAKAVR